MNRRDLICRDLILIVGAERRAFGGRAPGLPPLFACQGPQRLRGQGRPEGRRAAIAAATLEGGGAAP